MLKGDQHQTKSDAHPPEVARARNRAAAEHEDADQDQQERDPRYVERERLDDERRPDIRTEHDGKRRDKINQASRCERRHHQPGRRAALEKRCHPETSHESLEPISEGVA